MDCPICFDSLLTAPEGEAGNGGGGGEPSVCTTKCGHCFHRHCITQWIRTNPTCPTCRKIVYRNSLLEIFLMGKAKEPCKRCPKYKGLYHKAQKKLEAVQAELGAVQVGLGAVQAEMNKKVEILEGDLNIEKQFNLLNSQHISVLRKERDELQLKLKEAESRNAQLSSSLANSINSENVSSSLTSQSSKSASILNMGFLADDSSGNKGRPSSRGQTGSLKDATNRTKGTSSSTNNVSARGSGKASASKKQTALDLKPDIPLSPIEDSCKDTSSVVAPRRKSLPKVAPEPPVRRSERIITLSREPRIRQRPPHVQFIGVNRD